MPPTKETLEALAISEGEYEAIVERLGRKPNELELGLFGSLWSEHCAYKHSKPLLRMLPNTSPRMLVAPGQENAGAVDIGNGLAIVMKIESHNHPSAIEPYEGAATGVGGIVRDIFAMGARPIALLNSLRFGQPDTARNRYLFGGVVAGISEYGNCIGIPNVGGEVVFSDSYSDNPLVNAMCVGIVPADKLLSATTGTPGNLLMLVGADTGRDGIHGASGLASRSFDDDRELRPAVQVGNPFLEKVLIEACLELADSGRLVGLQDLGAAGLSTASVETANKGGTGIRIDVSKVARRESGMTPYEVMLSESQERMLVVVAPDDADEVTKILDKWDLHATVVGESTGDGDVSILDDGREHGRLPVGLLTDAPTYRVTGKKPQWLTDLQDFDLSQVPVPGVPPAEILLSLLASPNIASKLSVYRQYDHQVQTNTVIAPGGDAAVLRVKGTSTGIALATDGNGRKCYLDPYMGGMIAVAEACRNVSSVGATPIALTDCLNFGNPEKPEVYYQLEECVKGMSAASSAFAAPVISGNVSLYNESRGRDIYPTPIIGALGLLDDVTAHATMAFKNEGDVVVLLGSDEVRGEPAALAGSEYLEIVHDKVAGRPSIDHGPRSRRPASLPPCRRCWHRPLRPRLLRRRSGRRPRRELYRREIGFISSFDLSGRWDAALFGETESRIVVSLPEDRLTHLKRLSSDEGVPCVVLGRVGGSRLVLGRVLDLDLREANDSWSGGLEWAVGGADASLGSRL